MIREHERQPWAEQAIVAAGEEEGVPQAVLGDLVAMGAWDALDQTMQAQPPEVVGDGARREAATEERFESRAKVGIRETAG